MNKFRDTEENLSGIQEEQTEPVEVSSQLTENKSKETNAASAWLNTTLSREAAVKLLPFLLYLTSIGMLYIANKHYAEKNIRKIEKINKELKELKWEYMTTKHELMFKSKQTEVAKSTSSLGLKEAVVPPIKIVVKK